jgi:hypothetical protein
MEIEETLEQPDDQVVTEQPPVEVPPTEAKTVTVSTDVFAKIRAEENAKGKKSAQADLEARAKQLGFASLEEMFLAESTRQEQQKTKGDSTVTKPAAVTKPATKPVARPATPAAKPPASTADKRAQERWKAERERLNRVNAAETRKRKEAERTADALRAEISLREAAIRAGVNDVEYAMVLVRRELTGKTQDELKVFDESKFFDGLKVTKPVLFAVENRPANTSPQVKEQPPSAPKPATVVEQNPENKPVDVRKMTTAEYKAHLEKRGIRAPTA